MLDPNKYVAGKSSPIRKVNYGPEPQAPCTDVQLSFADLSKEQRVYARQLQEDEGWSRSEAIQLAYSEGGR